MRTSPTCSCTGWRKTPKTYVPVSKCLRRTTLRKKVELISGQLLLPKEDEKTRASQADVPSGTLHLKEKGIIPDPVRALLCDLMSFGLKVSQNSHAVATIATAAGAEVEGEISRRSMLRIMKEGGVAAGMQIVDDVKSTDSESLHFAFYMQYAQLLTRSTHIDNN